MNPGIIYSNSRGRLHQTPGDENPDQLNSLLMSCACRLFLSLFACPKSNPRLNVGQEKRPRQRTPHVGGSYPDLAFALLSLQHLDLHVHLTTTV